MKRKNIIAILVIALIAVLIVAKLVSNKRVLIKHNQIEDRSHIPTAVNVAPATIKIMDKEIVRPAIVLANEEAVIAATMPGKIIQLNIELGDRVNKGQTIGKIDTRANDIQVKSLELAVAKMKTDFERNQSLYQGNALSESQFLDSKFAYNSKKLQLDQLKQQISDSYIKSPLSGIITKKDHVAGEFVGAGTPVASVVDVNYLKINVFVNESEVRYIKSGQKVKITSNLATDTAFQGKVIYVSPNADKNFNYTVQIQIKNDRNALLRPGNYVMVHFHPSQERKSLQIPKKAIVSGIKNAFVYVVDGNRAKKRVIKVGRDNGSYIEVLNGLKAGEKVVVDGQINIIDNSLIEPKNTK
ncbi:MAG TPA: efflux RND transporter periplasmic adaptor subunit [Arachidicoccus soli]|nr:efflux RND transporter periplasmic adaptor subunit [Arachidicoccus soli]